MARTLIAGVLGALALAAPAVAAEPALDRAWGPGQQLEPEAEIADARVAPSGIGDSVALYSTNDALQRTQTSRLGVLGEPSQLASPGYWNMFELEGSPLHGAVGAWTGNGLRIAEIPPGGEHLELVRELPDAHSNYSYNRPVVAMGAGGDTVIAYIGGAAAGVAVHAVVKPAGGEWEAPVPVTLPGITDSRFARSAAVGADGTIVLGLVVDGRARVATRPPGGTFTLSEPIGESLPEHPWDVPRVGVDAAGAVVVAWIEDVPLNRTTPVRVAFRAPGADSFGPPQDAGVRATSGGEIRLNVSMPGEVALLVEASTDLEGGDGTHIEGLHVAFGLTHLQKLGPPTAISGIWGMGPHVDMNARGDLIVVWEECCPLTLRARRRAPLGSFGPEVHVAPPIEFEGWRGSRWPLSVDIDDLGNARAAWVDSEPPVRFMIAADGPLLDTALPEVGDVGDVIPPVLPAGEEPPVTPGPPQSAPMPDPAPLPAHLGPRTMRPVDRRAPKATVVPSRPGRRRVLTRLRCDEACGVRLHAVAGRRSGRWVDVLLREGRSLRVGVPLPRRARGTLRLEGVVTDESGNSRRLDRSVRRR